MKKLIFKILVFVVCCFSLQLSAQENWSTLVKSKESNYNNITETEKAFINEVYGSKANELVWNSKNPNLKNGLIRLLRERIEIIDGSTLKKQKHTLSLFDKGLADKYNPNLRLDKVIDLKNFNPLKYNLDFFSNGTYLYKIDGTNAYLQVTSQHRLK
tara:strand:+ start:1566 stop:2036 length:471 start_codon:yes stop_codon:yes gene_type:complete